MPSLRSNLSPGVSVLSWRIMKCGSFPIHHPSCNAYDFPAVTRKQSSDRIVGTTDQVARRVALRARSWRWCQGGIEEKATRAVRTLPLAQRIGIDLAIMSRKLETVRRGLDLLAEQGKVEGFFKNVGNANQLSGLLEDVRDAMIEYQVRIPPNHMSLQYLMFESDFIATGYIRQ